MRSECGLALALVLASVLGCAGEQDDDVTRRSGHDLVDAARDETIVLARRAREGDRSAAAPHVLWCGSGQSIRGPRSCRRS